MQQELERETRGFRLLAVADKARVLAAEKRRDLAEMLTSAELVEYELRHSRTSAQLRWQMTQINDTEERFRIIYGRLFGV